MHIERSVTSISWIPSEAVDGSHQGRLRGRLHPLRRAPRPTRSVLTSLPSVGARSASPTASASPTTSASPSSSPTTARSSMPGYPVADTSARPRCGSASSSRWPPSACPTASSTPEIGDGWVRFTQTAGGRTGVPAPRAVRRPPFVQYFAPIAWSTLELTVHADGHSERRLVGASPFPRHWVYDERRHARRQERPDRLQGLGRHGLRHAHAVGRRGLAAARHRGRDGARAAAVDGDHARCGAKPEIRTLKAGER